MIEAVLFDLDETLLDLNLDAYVRSFSLGRVDLVGRIARMPAIRVAVPYCRALVGMLGERDDDLTNAAFLDGRFEDLTGIPLDDPAIAGCISFYDREVFNPSARASRAIGGRPMPGAHRCLEACLRLGVKVALATNPTFPEACTRERMAWAGIDDFPFDHVTFIENATRAKPWARYYEEVCAAIGADPKRCLMVGNDPKNDFATGATGLRTCYVGRRPTRRAWWRGSLEELARELPRLVERG